VWFAGEILTQLTCVNRMLFHVVPGFQSLAAHPMFMGGQMLPERFVDHW
jgi:hypothetical protein